VATPPFGHAHPDGRIPDDRRRQPRLYLSLPITVLAATADRDLVACGTWLDNLSAGGLYVRLPGPLALGSPVIARLSGAEPPGRLAVCVALGGRVLRVEPRRHHRYGTALVITWQYTI
jgi:hypothetical protein